MKLNIDQSNLQLLRTQMRAERRVWMPDEKLLEIRQVQESLKQKQGINGNLDEIVISNGGLLSHKGQQIAIYIRDHTNKHSNKGSVLTDPKFGNRIHVYECKTLEQMRKDGRFSRFVQTTRSKSFLIDVNISGKILERNADLKVCKHCLKALKYKNYYGGNSQVWETFDLDEFFATYSTYFSQSALHNDFAAPSPDYARNWSEVSRKTRKLRNWTCQNCHVNLSEPKNRKYLHTHHKNGTKSDNSLRNLVVLCAICHAKEPSHQHMQVHEETREAIEQARNKRS